MPLSYDRVPFSPELQRNIERAERSLGCVKQIIGPRILQQTTVEVDAREGADLTLDLTLYVSPTVTRFAVRTRGQGYADRYPYDFTLRSRSRTGAQTELQKIMAGYGHLLFYGHERLNAQPDPWYMIRLDIFRAIWGNPTLRALIRSSEVDNHDGTWFRHFDLRSFPVMAPDILYASSCPVPRRPINQANDATLFQHKAG